jgi:outer membrane lipoprotein SlyB
MSIRLFSLALLSLLLAACASGGNRYYGPTDGYARCYDCGEVERIERVYGERESSGAGAVLGGIIGGVLGNQIGSGSGRAAATAAGAIAGGVAGNQIEKNTRGSVRYDLFVRMDDGRRIVLSQRDLNGIREGSRIQVRGNSARLY